MSNEEKLFYGIGEVADIVQVKPYVLRYWETEFKKLNPQKSFTGQRTYRTKDIQVALTIKKLLYEDKYTIAGAIQRLTEIEARDHLLSFSVAATTENTTEETAPIDPPLDVVQTTEPATASPAEASAIPEPSKPQVDEKKVKDLKSLLEATKKVLKKYNLS